VYRKPTHTNLYVNAKYHHHPSNKKAVLSTLLHRARSLCDEDNLQAELVFLKDILRVNGYSDRQIHRALKSRPLLPQPENKTHSVAFLPFVGTVFNRISRVLARHNIKSVGLPHMKLSSLLRPVKDRIGVRTPGVYRISCECGRVYIWADGPFRVHQVKRASTAHKTVSSRQVGRSQAQYRRGTSYSIPRCFSPRQENQIYGPHCKVGH
jgi:hypothetical protein